MMSEEIDPTAIANAELQKIGRKLEQDQKDMITPMFLALQKEGNVFVGQGPTGMGKTYVIGSVAKGLVKSGKRVCISVPTYTHLKDVMSKHLRELNEPFTILRGLTHLGPDEGCPLLKGAIPTSIFCSRSKNSKTGPNSEKCKEIQCTVRKEMLAAADSKLVLTVYHKLLSNPEILKDFDVVIFDESHSLEAAVRSYRISKVRIDDVEVLQKFIEGFEEEFELIKNGLGQLNGLTEVPLGFVEREIVEPLRPILEKVQEKIQETEQNFEKIPSGVPSAFYSLQAATRAIEKAGFHRFVPHQGAILAIPHQVTFHLRDIKNQSKKLSVGLISATIENPRLHANDSGFPFHALAAPIVSESPRTTRKFKNRPIFGLIDGPVLRKDPKSMEFYDTARKEANKILGNIIPAFNEPILILCRSRQDAKSIEQYLCTLDGLKSRLYTSEEGDTVGDIDKIESRYNAQIDAGKNIILTTSSSKVWEGVNLKRLKLLVVDALPYAAPEPYEKRESGSWGSWKTSRPFRFMIRRFQQGIGRLMRTDDDPWGIVIVIDGRFAAQWKTIKSVLPNHMTNKGIIKFVTRESLKSEFNSMTAMLKQKTKKDSYV